jgi:uncharacterized protein (TIGR01777 family)
MRLWEGDAMRVIIAGGTGLIGRALAASLAGDGHEVFVLSRAPERAAGLPGGVRVEQWDGRSARGWDALADGADAVVNLAGASIGGEGFFPSRWTAARKRAIRESRLDAGQAVVQAVERASQKPGVVVQSSAVGYYGPDHGDALLDDSAAPAGDFLGGVAVEWEASTAAVERAGVRRAIVRSGVVLSAEDGALPRLLLPFKLFAGGPFGSGRQWVSWIHLADEVRAIRFVIENQAASGPFNLSAPNPVTNADLGRAIGRVMRRPYFVPVPGFAMRAAFGEVASVVLDGQRVVPHRLQALGFEFRFTDAEAALRDLLS